MEPRADDRGLRAPRHSRHLALARPGRANGFEGSCEIHQLAWPDRDRPVPRRLLHCQELERRQPARHRGGACARRAVSGAGRRWPCRGIEGFDFIPREGKRRHCHHPPGGKKGRRAASDRAVASHAGRRARMHQYARAGAGRLRRNGRWDRRRGRRLPRLVGSEAGAADQASWQAHPRLPYLRLAGADARPAERPRHDGRRRDRPAAHPLVGRGCGLLRLPRGRDLLRAQLVAARPRRGAAYLRRSLREVCMKGAVFLGDRKIEVRNFPDPTPGHGEVVIGMKASGMCGSDLKFYRSPPGAAQAALGIGGNSEPFIGGHEPCGVVVARGAGVSEREAPTGQRVMDHHYSGCGVTAHGGHADYLKVPAKTIVQLPEELSFAEGAAVACGTGTAYGALKRMKLCGGDTLAVFGQGPVGLSATVLGVAMGARVIAVETSPERMKLAEEFGADAVIDASKEDAVLAIKDLTKGAGADLALDCTGAAAARRAAVRCVRTWGTACY